MDENKDEVFVDDLETEDTVVEQKDWWETVVDWIADHKLICCLSVIGIPLFLIWLGAKMFSKTETVEIEKLPDPTIMDMYDRIPVEEHTYTDFKYVLKDEYRDQ